MTTHVAILTAGVCSQHLSPVDGSRHRVHCEEARSTWNLMPDSTSAIQTKKREAYRRYDRKAGTQSDY